MINEKYAATTRKYSSCRGRVVPSSILFPPKGRKLYTLYVIVKKNLNMSDRVFMFIYV